MTSVDPHPDTPAAQAPMLPPELQLLIDPTARLCDPETGVCALPDDDDGTPESDTTSG
jgi:hypothetical protein